MHTIPIQMANNIFLMFKIKAFCIINSKDDFNSIEVLSLLQKNLLALNFPKYYNYRKV